MATAKQKFIATMAPGANRRKKVTEKEVKTKQPKMEQNNNQTGWNYWAPVDENVKNKIKKAFKIK